MTTIRQLNSRLDALEEQIRSEAGVEFDVPIPLAVKRQFDTRRYPFHLMRVGESVHYPSKPAYLRAARAARNHAQQHNVKFTQKIDEDGAGGRIWRIE